MTITTMREVLESYLLKMTDLQIINYLDRVWDQNVVSEAREIYIDDIQSQLNYYLQSTSHIEASFDGIMESWIEQLFEVKKTTKLDFETRLDEYYNNTRYEYEEELIEHWYSPHMVDEVNDWRDEFCQKEYNIYLIN